MRNIKLVIEYDGTDYKGWQIQAAGVPTIQFHIEEAIFKLTGRTARVSGAARTDSGVSACGQVANFKTPSKLPLKNIINGLNAYLPDDIAVLDAQEMGSDFHSRFSAKGKRYRYLVYNSEVRSPLNLRYSYSYQPKLSLKKMKEESLFLVGKHDFKCFQAQDKIERASVRTVKDISISRKGKLLVFEIEADGFLYHMVRNIVGTLLEVGVGRFDRGYVKNLIKSRNRALAGPTVPALGLSLVEVHY